MSKISLSSCLAVLCLASSLDAAEPKKLLVVSATVGARHTSIPNGEQMLRDLAAKSGGQFTLILMSDAADYPFPRVAAPVVAQGGGARGAIPGFPGQIPTASPEQQAALAAAGTPIAALMTAAATAQTQLAAAPFSLPDEVQAKIEALRLAELNLALARATALTQLQASSNRLSPELVQALAGMAPPTARGGGARGGGAAAAPDNGPVIARLFQQFLSADALKNYDGVLFLSATGLLPFPDREAFLRWVADGHAVVGLHGAMDTGYYTPDDYVEMLSGGARFASYPGGTATARKIFKVDATHPATKDWTDGLAVIDEFFQFNRKNPAVNSTSIPGIDRTKVHSLLDMDYEGQRLAVAWTKMHGRGRVFYTSLGHRDDVLLGSASAAGGNATEVSTAYQQHVLNGIRWALGLVEGDTTLGNAK